MNIVLIIDIVLFTALFLIISKKAFTLIKFDEKAKNLHNVKSRKYFYVEGIFLAITFLSSFYIIEVLKGSAFFEAIKFIYVALMFDIYRRSAIKSLKKDSRNQIEEQVETLRGKSFDNKEELENEINNIKFIDDYKYYDIEKELKDDLLEVKLTDKKVKEDTYSYVIHFNILNTKGAC